MGYTWCAFGTGQLQTHHTVYMHNVCVHNEYCIYIEYIGIDVYCMYRCINTIQPAPYSAHAYVCMKMTAITLFMVHL